MKIFDTITFFRENFITNLRFEILNDVVDYFVICESKYDHQGKEKKLNFYLKNQEFKKKIIYLVLDKPFRKGNSAWQNQALQREYILNGLKDAKKDDYIMFSDPDEIPDPKKINEVKLKKKYGIFLQKCFCYKFNLYNKYESPWEGTRICQFKNLGSVDYLRQKILSKNLSSPFWKFYKNKSIELIDNGGWHFNSLFTPEDISLKLKTFAHNEFSKPIYSDVEVIRRNILEKKDLFKRGWNYQKIELDETFPSHIYKNKKLFKEWIV